MRPSVVASLFINVLLGAMLAGSAEAQGWDLIMTPGRQRLSRHVGWANCGREIAARNRALERLLHGEQVSGKSLPELAPPFLMCVPANDTALPGERTPLREMPHTRTASPRWAVWRSLGVRSAPDGVFEEIDSLHESMRDCELALVERFNQLQAGGYTPSFFGERETRMVLGGMGRNVVAYRCRPDVVRGADTR